MTPRRKLAAIMSADVAGYSRLMAADEAATLRALNDARGLFAERIPAHHGRLVDTAGDSVLAEFDSAVEAVSCGIEVQRELSRRNADLPEIRRMAFRMGVNLGDVMEENAALYGDGVNIAARLQALSDPGGLCISGTVFDQVDGKLPLAFRSMGEQAVKNIPKPIRVYRLVQGSTATAATMRWKAWAAAAAALVLVAVGIAWWWPATHGTSPAAAGATPRDAAARPRLAVLPLDNFSARSEDEYFSDGMTEELISKLSRVAGMDVIARTSVMRYKRTDKSIADIGRELGVSAVLEGSVRKAGDKVRITVQLIDVGTQAHMWSQDYDRELQDIFTTQSEIADQVTKALHVALVEPEPGDSNGNVDLETYTLYLKGRYHAADFSLVSLRRAIEYFDRAVQRSPGDARSWAGMARAYSMLGFWAYVSPGESFAKAKPAAEKALALDGRLADGHIAMGLVRFLYDWDWAGAESAYKRAIQLSPGDADAHLFLGIWLKQQGQNSLAEAEIVRANELDPLNLMASAELGWVDYFGRRFDDAVTGCRNTLAKDANYMFALSCLQAALTLRQDPESVVIAKKLLDLSSQDPYFVSGLGWTYGVLGRRDEALRALATLEANPHPSPTHVYYVHLGMGNADKAMEWMEKAYQARWSEVIWIKSAPEYDTLRSNPRFQALLRNMKLDG